MHQLASFLVSIFLSPLNWIILLIMAAYFFRKKKLKKTFIIFAIGLFIIFGDRWLLNLFANAWQPSPVAVTTLPVYSCGIVAGGFASPHKNGDGYFNATADRFIQAVKLYKRGKIKNILISGGNGKDTEKSFREAAWVKSQLIIFGIPDSVIITEDQSNNTKDNAMNSKRLLDSLHLPPPYLLISSAYHIPRAALTFKKSGVPVDVFPCNYMDGNTTFSISDLLPRPSVLLSWDRYLKEAVGYYFVLVFSS
ncbi:MAG: YdcF family protein [Ginsengibacter sp.]